MNVPETETWDFLNRLGDYGNRFQTPSGLTRDNAVPSPQPRWMILGRPTRPACRRDATEGLHGRVFDQY